MTHRDIKIKQLEQALTQLFKFVPATKDELDDWYEQARPLQEGDLLTGAPHYVWHYLSDADIRMKDEKYAEAQNGQMKLLLEQLKQGVMPSDEDRRLTLTDLSNLIKRWLRR